MKLDFRNIGRVLILSLCIAALCAGQLLPSVQASPLKTDKTEKKQEDKKGQEAQLRASAMVATMPAAPHFDAAPICFYVTTPQFPIVAKTPVLPSASREALTYYRILFSSVILTKAP